jgi:hypothetical protein
MKMGASDVGDGVVVCDGQKGGLDRSNVLSDVAERRSMRERVCRELED